MSGETCIVFKKGSVKGNREGAYDAITQLTVHMLQEKCCTKVYLFDSILLHRLCYRQNDVMVEI